MITLRKAIFEHVWVTQFKFQLYEWAKTIQLFFEGVDAKVVSYDERLEYAKTSEMDIF